MQPCLSAAMENIVHEIFMQMKIIELYDNENYTAYHKSDVFEKWRPQTRFF